MQLIRCYIENFGGITNMNFEFSEALNIINKDNGWGKTTFAVFIKSMFFGMESTTKRKLDENERKKYMPWNAGRYGGNIEFEVNANKYRVERFFGARDREDYFALYDLTTNLLTDDFSDNLGEEIFKIDREAFERSIYIPQQQISVEANDSLSAKLSNILESDNDINKFESAISRLDDAARLYKKKGDRGKISDIESNLRIAERELNDCLSREAPYDELKNLLSIKHNERVELDKQLVDIDRQMEYVGGFAEKTAKKNHYEELKNDVLEKENALLPLEDFFINGIPDYDEVVMYEDNARQLASYRLTVMQNMICDEDREEYKRLSEIFIDGVPNDDELNKCEEAIDNVSNLDGSMKAYILTDEENSEMSRLSAIYGDTDDFELQLEECNKKYKRYLEIATDIERENSNLISLEAWKDHNVLEEENGIKIKKNEIGIGIAGILAIVIGIVLITNLQEIIGSIMVGMGVAGVAAMFLVFIRNRWVSPEEEKQIVKNEEDILSTRTAINNLELERKNIQIMLSDFSDKYSDRHSINGMMNILPEISSSYNNYKQLILKKQKNDDKAFEILSHLNNQVKIIDNTIGRFYSLIGFDNTNVDEGYTRVTGTLVDDGTIKLSAEDGVDKKQTENGVIFTASKAAQGSRYNTWKMNKRIAQEKKWREVLRTVREKKNDYNMLENKISIFEKNYNVMKEIEPVIYNFISKYFEDFTPTDYEDCLVKIKNKVLDLSRLERERQLASDKLQKFISENEVSDLENLQKSDITIEVLQEQRKNVIVKMNNVRDEYDHIKTRCSEFSDIVTKKPELESEVERLKNDLNEANAKYDILSTTKMFLEKAKNQFSSRYLTGLNDSFVKYVRLLSGELDGMDGSADSCLRTATLNTQLNVNVEAYGSKKEIGFLSTGCRDLLGICSRFALVDAMYEVEKPFLILDDPFVNLDEEKILNSLIFLEQVAKEYQIIYFACHPSRVM